MGTNVKDLMDTIKAKGMNVPELANKIGIDASTLYRKMSAGGEKFTIGEVHKMMEVIPLSQEEANRIFLSINSHYCEKWV